MLQAQKRGLVEILWIPIKASSHLKSPLRHYQAVIDTAKPLAKMKGDERDAAWVRICQAIERALKRRKNRGSQPASRKARTAGPKLRVIPTPARVKGVRRLLLDLEELAMDGELSGIQLARLVIRKLETASGIRLAKPYDPQWVTRGILMSDHLCKQLRESAGDQGWQRDFAIPATPIFVGVLRSLRPSSDAQALVKPLCDAMAARLRLEIIWPQNPSAYNDSINGIYRACLRARELDNDDVLGQLKGLTIIGPR